MRTASCSFTLFTYDYMPCNSRDLFSKETFSKSYSMFSQRARPKPNRCLESTGNCFWKIPSDFCYDVIIRGKIGLKNAQNHQKNQCFYACHFKKNYYMLFLRTRCLSGESFRVNWTFFVEGRR